MNDTEPDYRLYSLEELRDARAHIDAETYPARAERLDFLIHNWSQSEFRERQRVAEQEGRRAALPAGIKAVAGFWLAAGTLQLLMFFLGPGIPELAELVPAHPLAGLMTKYTVLLSQVMSVGLPTAAVVGAVGLLDRARWSLPTLQVVTWLALAQIAIAVVVTPVAVAYFLPEGPEVLSDLLGPTGVALAIPIFLIVIPPVLILRYLYADTVRQTLDVREPKPLVPTRRVQPPMSTDR